MIGKFLELLPVIKSNELKKFTFMSLLIFFILFNYNLIYSLKEALIVPKLGAEVIVFIELWVVLPAVFIFTLSYIKLSTLMGDKKKIFYIISTFFISFFLFFAFFLYPNIDLITPGKVSEGILIQEFPHLKWFIILYSNWPLALFNIFSDLWINTMSSLLFWQYANSITPSEQAKRFYPIFGLISNFSLIACGILLKHSAICACGEKSVLFLTLVIVSICIICMLLFHYLYCYINKEISNLSRINSFEVKLSFKESLILIFSSRYLLYLAMAVISYGITINLSQSLWRAQVIKLHPSTAEYIGFMSDYNKSVGAISLVVMLIASAMIRKFSWIKSAVATPILMLFSGTIFFLWIFLHKHIIQTSSEHFYLVCSVVIGAVHMILAKSSKFSFFDTTKELAYIPLEENLRDKGKAAVDLLAERIGKSSGALIQSVLFSIMPSFTYLQFAPVFFLVSFIIWLIWLSAVIALNKKYSLFYQ